MERAQIEELLSNYKENAARCAYLAERISALEASLIRARAFVVDDNTSITQVISDMPRGGGTSDPTARLGMMLAAGHEPQSITDIEDALCEARAELNAKRAAVRYVDVWLMGLTERERYVVERKTIQGEFWRAVVEGFNDKFGEVYTRASVRSVERRAIEKICRIAK